MKHKMRNLRRRAQDAWEQQEVERERSLGDFTTTYRVIPLSLAAVAIGVVTAYIAWALLRLIGLFTNLFYFGRWSTSFVSPAQNHLGAWAVLVPVAGSLTTIILFPHTLNSSPLGLIARPLGPSQGAIE